MHFYALTCLSSVLYTTKHIIRRENKSMSTQEKAESTKKGSNQSDHSKLKMRVGMERCLPVGRVGEDGSSIRVLDHEKKTKRHKKGKQPNQHIPTV